MRLFVAFGMPASVRSALDAATTPVRAAHPALRWTPPATWHVTLAFLGEVDPARLDDVEAAVRSAVGDVGAGPVELALAGAGTFGDRVAWLRVEDEPAGAVARLGAAIQSGLASRRLPVDRKDVRPHVTLARARGRRGRLPPGLIDALPRPDLTWRVDEATVFRSHLGSGPLEHEPLVGVPLVAAGGAARDR